TMPPRHLRTTLEWMVTNNNKKVGQKFPEVIEQIVTHAFGYLFKDKRSFQNKSDLARILSDLKGTYGSSRSTDPVLLNLRETVETYVEQATQVKHSGSLSSVRTGLLLYIVLRALTMKHY